MSPAARRVIRTRPRACSARRPRASRRAAPRRAERRPSRAGAGSSGSSPCRPRGRRWSRRGDEDDEQLLRSARERVLQRDRGGVRVRERLVGLRDEQREQRHDRGEAARRRPPRAAQPGSPRSARERARRRGRAARRPARSSRARSPRGAAPRLREPRVVGRVRHPRDRDPDDDVRSLPHRSPPSPSASQSAPRSAPSSAHQVR